MMVILCTFGLMSEKKGRRDKSTCLGSCFATAGDGRRNKSTCFGICWENVGIRKVFFIPLSLFRSPASGLRSPLQLVEIKY